MRALRIVHVDAFTAQPFSGNAAAVVILEQAYSNHWMQRVAVETNLAATVFLWPHAQSNSQDSYCVRWFTVQQELPLCGHGTLAAAHVLWTEGYVEKTRPITLLAEHYTLTATYDGAWITLDFPRIDTVPSDIPDALQQGLGMKLQHVRKSHHSYLVELETEAAVRALVPEITLLARLDTARVIVTSRADSGGYDFVSRFFAPGLGIAEDPVTGSAHCCLAPFWAERLGKTNMVGFQASVRGGVVQVSVNGDRVGLSGQGVTVSRGTLAEATLQDTVEPL